MMEPGEVASLCCHLPPETTSVPYPSYFNMQQNNTPLIHFGSFSMSHATADFPAMHQIPAGLMISCASANSTSDEADEQQQRILIDERKRRRMISNRESARRSRMRKQKHLDELCSLVANLRTANRRLMDELNRTIGDHHRILRENARLTDEASDLRKTLNRLQLKKNMVAADVRGDRQTIFSS